MDMLEFGAKLKDLRQTRNISQEELGNVLGVSRATVGSWESGRRNISVKHLEAVSVHFGLEVGYFTGEPTKDEILDLLERARALFNNDALPLEDKQKLSEEVMRLYLQVKGRE